MQSAKIYNVVLYLSLGQTFRKMGARGLEARDHWFWIDGKKTRLFSGAMHYFRIPREYWKDRLIKLRSSGCNVLETYVPLY